MSSNRKRIPRSRKKELDSSMTDLLLYGEVEEGTPAAEFYRGHFFDDFEMDLKIIWKQHSKLLLQEWNKNRHTGEPWIIEYLKGEI